MEQLTPAKVSKGKAGNVTTAALRVKRETKRRIQVELAKINKKAYGRNVRIDALISCAMSLLGDADIIALQESSLSNADRLERQFRDYAKNHSGASKDEFIGKLLSGEIGQSLGKSPSGQVL
jgi:hypothetical protein